MVWTRSSLPKGGKHMQEQFKKRDGGREEGRKEGRERGREGAGEAGWEDGEAAAAGVKCFPLPRHCACNKS